MAKIASISTSNMAARIRFKLYFWILVAAILVRLEMLVRKHRSLKYGPIVILVLEQEPGPTIGKN